MITCAVRIRAKANNLIFYFVFGALKFPVHIGCRGCKPQTSLGTTRSGYKGCFKINMEPRGRESEVRDDISSPNFRFVPSFMAVDAERN